MIKNMHQRGKTEWSQKKTKFLGIDVPADLKKSNFAISDLEGACFKGADLSGADLSYTNLVNVDFRGANLDLTQMAGAKIKGADFRGTDVIHAKISGLDFSETKYDRRTFDPFYDHEHGTV